MTAGLVGFLVILALVVAAVFLFRSMTKHMRRVPPTFDQTPEDDESPAGRPATEQPDGRPSDGQSSGRA